MEIKNLINKEFCYAVVGASANQEKYGYKIIQDLNDAGYDVIPINTHEHEIQSLEVFRDIKDIPFRIDVVIFVVPPKVTEEVLKEVKELNITKVWMQTGSENEVSIQFCEDNKIEYVHNTCIMVKKEVSTQENDLE